MRMTTFETDFVKMFSKSIYTGIATGRQCTVPFSVQKWIISRRRCAMLLNISSEKSKVTRELALVELSLACLMVT
jgi:hypothetical protein